MVINVVHTLTCNNNYYNEGQGGVVWGGGVVAGVLVQVMWKLIFINLYVIKLNYNVARSVRERAGGRASERAWRSVAWRMRVSRVFIRLRS